VTTTHRVEVPGPLDGERVDRVVSFLVGVPRSEAVELIGAGHVALGGRAVTAKSARVAVGDVLEVEVADAGPPAVANDAVDLPIVPADDRVLVVDKPAGLVVHPGAGHRGDTLVNGLLARYPGLAGHDWPDPSRPGIVHRLDKGTSGLLVVALDPEAQEHLAAQLRHRTVERRYLALVWGNVHDDAGIVDAPIGRSAREPTRMAVREDGRRAVTRYDVVRRWERPQPTTLVRCALETGRTHQIRVHLAAIGHPVVGDGRYEVVPTPGGRRAAVSPDLRPARPFLHAAVLGFDHPTTNARVRFESSLPADLTAVLDALA